MRLFTHRSGVKIFSKPYGCVVKVEERAPRASSLIIRDISGSSPYALQCGLSRSVVLLSSECGFTLRPFVGLRATTVAKNYTAMLSNGLSPSPVAIVDAEYL